MLVNCLPLIVIVVILEEVDAGNGLSAFICLEAQIECLLAFGLLLIAQSTPAKHQVVVGLQILGIDLQHSMENLNGLLKITLQEV